MSTGMTVKEPDWVASEIRSNVLAIIKLIKFGDIPGGSILSMIIGFFWGDPGGTHAIWDALKKYAEEIAKEVVDAERIDRLYKRLDGLQKIAKNYSDTSPDSPQKGQHLTTLIDDLDLYEADFWDERNPEKMFSLFIPYGTLKLAALAEQALRYKENYGKEDPDAKLHMKTLRDNISKYTLAAQHLFDRVYAWRFGLLKATQEQEFFTTYYESTWKLTDHYKQDELLVQDGRGDFSSGFHNPTGQVVIEQARRRRADYILNGFVENLQHLMATAQLWQYIQPGNDSPKPVEVISDQGPWGQCEGTRFENQGSRITEIRVWHSTVIECFEIFYDGKSAGPHGNPRGGTLSSLVLDKDEFVTEVTGRAGRFVDNLIFTTNKGRTVGGGDEGGDSPFSSGMKFWEGTKLTVNGFSDSLRLTGISLRWQHTVPIPYYVPSYKQKQTSLSSRHLLSLKAENGKYISALVEEYSGRAAADEYWPKQGDTPVKLQFHKPGNEVPLNSGDKVQIMTTETAAGDYKFLGAYRSDDVYYYQYSEGDEKQLWALVKVIPSDGPILFGERIWLRNIADCAYLAPTDDGYFTRTSEPCEWEFALTTLQQ